MKYFYYLLFFILFACFTPSVFSQTAEEKVISFRDSLTITKGNEKVDMLIRLCRLYRNIDTDSLFFYAKQAYQLSQQQNYPSGLANSNLFMGLAHHDSGKRSEARLYYLKAFYLFRSIDDRKGVASASNCLGNTYIEEANYKKALEYHNLALDLRLQMNDKKGMSASYSNIGNVYAGQEDWVMALQNHLKALVISEEINDTSQNGKSGLAMSYFNIGRLYTVVKSYSKAEEFLIKAQKMYQQMDGDGGLIMVLGAQSGVYEEQGDYERAIDCSMRAIKMAQEAGYDNEVADNNIRLASLHYKRALQQEKTNKDNLYQSDYNAALDYADRAYRYYNSIHYELGIANSFVLMGKVYNQQGKYDLASSCFNKAMEIPVGASTKAVIYEGLYLLNLKQKNYKPALDYYREYTSLKDSAYNTENTLKFMKLGNSYEEDKKEKIREMENKLKELTHQEEIKRQRSIQLFILIGLLLVVVFAGFVYRSYRQKQKANILITKQKSEVENAYKIIEQQKKIVDEHNKDITDSINYARRIQSALLASDSLLNKNLPEYFVLYKPKDIVSGDFYWASEIREANSQKFVLCTGDCTGHGVPGAFMSLLNISKLNETINEKRITRPDLILNNVREEIIKALNPENALEECNDGMDCTICTFEFTSDVSNTAGMLYYAAANNPFYLIRDNQLIVSKADKIPVGKSSREKEPFLLNKIELLKGDTIYLLTDGYADQFGGAAGKKFKYKPLEELLLSCHQKKMNVQKEILNSTIEQWRGSNEQVDDILIIGVRV